MTSLLTLLHPLKRQCTCLLGITSGMDLQEDVKGAEEFVKGEITRLLSGRCEAWEMVMTGGLWRVTGQQVASAAEGTAPADGEEVRGPHASLAVRLSVRSHAALLFLSYDTDRESIPRHSAKIF